MELMRKVLTRSSDIRIPETEFSLFERTPEYWAGWALAYYQWQSSYSFSFIQRNGLDINTVLSLYPTLHEADLTKFVATAAAIMKRHLKERHNVLKTIRKQQRITQKQLSEISGVSLRMIQAYEQGNQDIRKAEVQTVFALARVLGCTLETLFI
jgi:DNA-binding XRE family transcriptional regulator